MNEYKIFICLSAFNLVYSICFEKIRFLSSSIPKYFTVLDQLTSWLKIAMRKSIARRFVKNIIYIVIN